MRVEGFTRNASGNLSPSRYVMPSGREDVALALELDSYVALTYSLTYYYQLSLPHSLHQRKKTTHITVKTVLNKP